MDGIRPTAFKQQVYKVKLQELQPKNSECQAITTLLTHKMREHPSSLHEDDILYEKVTNIKKHIEALVVLCMLMTYILHQMHDALGNNNILHTHYFVK